jgi:outer membrane immunogenic protein
MTRTLLALVTALALAPLAAQAADMPVKAPAPLPPPAPSWTGCYLEAGYGYGMWNQQQHTETFPGLLPVTAANTTDGGRGWLGRFGGGCDYQLSGGLSSWVIGAFGEYDAMNLKGTNNFQNVGLAGVFGAPTWAYEKENSAWYAGGRIGYVVTPNLLSYFDGGYTETHFNGQSFTFLNTNVPVGGFLPAATYHGWFVGGGVEYALNFSWLPIHGLFWRNEYRFAEYRSKDLVTFGAGAAPGFAQHTQPFVQTATSTLIWRFNWFH